MLCDDCLDEVKKIVDMDVHENQITGAVANAHGLEARSNDRIKNTESVSCRTRFGIPGAYP